jgi:hypothetical protein
MIKSILVDIALPFVKKYWRELLLITCLFGVFAKNHLDYKRLEEAYAVSQTSLKNQIVTLKELHADELARRDIALKDYQSTIEELKKSHESQLDDLEKDRDTKHAEIIDEIVERKQFSENKEERAGKIQAAFGFEYVP